MEKSDEFKVHSIKFNVVMNMILTSSSFLFPLITVPYVSRVLSTFGTGSVAFAQSVVSYFSLAALLGIPMYGVRECARVRDNREELSKTVQELVIILLISSAIVYILFIVAVFSTVKLRQDIPLMIIFSSVIWLASCGVEWFYQAIEQYGYITIRNIAMKLLGLILMFVFVHQISDYHIYAAIVVVASYGSNILNVFRLRKFVTFSGKRQLNLRRHFRPMLAFTVSSISSGIYAQLDLVLVGFLGTPSMVGLYQLVVKIKNLCGTAVNSVGNVMLPRLSYYESQGGKDRTVKLIAKNINFLAIAGSAFISILLLCANPIVMLLGGRNFVGSAVPLMIASPALLFSSVNTMLSQYLVATQHERTYALINLLGLFFASVFGSLLIPQYGINGAAISVALCEFCVLLVRIIVLHEFMRTAWRYLDLGKILLSTSIAFIPNFIILKEIHIASITLSFLLPTFLYCIIYLSCLLIFKESLVKSLLPSHQQNS